MADLTDSQRQGFARQLLANPLWQEMLDRMEKSTLAKWRGTSPEDDHKRTTAWYEDRAIREIGRRVNDLARGPYEQQKDES